MGRELLNARQIKFLEILQNDQDLTANVYLTGGTALAAFYLNHRESEDLDFFSEKEIEPITVEIFLKKCQKELGFDTFEFQRSFNRNLFFLYFSDEVLKTEFTYFPFPRLVEGKREGNLSIDSLRDIAVNKVFTINQQTRARDFVDLYFIVRQENWKLLDLVKDARIKFDTHIDFIQLGAQLIKAGELKDMPRLRVPLDTKNFIEFFLKEAVSLKGDIIS